MTPIEKINNQFAVIEATIKDLEKLVAYTKQDSAELYAYLNAMDNIPQLERKVKSAVRKLAADLNFKIKNEGKRIDIYVVAFINMKRAWSCAMYELFNKRTSFWLTPTI